MRVQLACVVLGVVIYGSSSAAFVLRRDDLFWTNITEFSFVPSSCNRTEDDLNDWKDTPLSPTARPPLSPTSSISEIHKKSHDDAVAVNTTGPRITDPNPFTAGSKDDEDDLDFCTEERSLKFNNAVGFYRTVPFFMGTSRAEYHLTWHTDYPSKVVVWIDQGIGTHRWRPLYESPVGGELRGEVTMREPRVHHDRQIIFEISLSVGTLGWGTSGEVGLYSFTTFPK